MKRKLCRWSKNAEIARINMGLSRKELADRIGRSPQYLSAVFHQRVRSPITEKLISDFLNIEDDGKDDYD